MIKFKYVGKIYGEGESSVKALEDIDLELPSGKFISIVGKSGSGKSTMLNLIGALDISTSGTIFNDDLCINDLSADQLADYRNKNIGFVFQSFYLEPSFTVLENVEMPMVIAGVDKQIREQKAKEIIKQLDIEDKTHTKVSTLSGGQKQRVSIARALVHQPKLVLADEPTGNLDTKNAKFVIDTLRKISEEGKTVILVTHNLEDAYKTDLIIELEDGKVSKITDNTKVANNETA